MFIECTFYREEPEGGLPSLFMNDRTRWGGHTRHTARPRMSAAGTGPYDRESCDTAALSPRSSTAPVFASTWVTRLRTIIG